MVKLISNPTKLQAKLLKDGSPKSGVKFFEGKYSNNIDVKPLGFPVKGKNKLGDERSYHPALSVEGMNEILGIRSKPCDKGRFINASVITTQKKRGQSFLDKVKNIFNPENGVKQKFEHTLDDKGNLKSSLMHVNNSDGSVSTYSREWGV